MGGGALMLLLSILFDLPFLLLGSSKAAGPRPGGWSRPGGQSFAEPPPPSGKGDRGTLPANNDTPPTPKSHQSNSLMVPYGGGCGPHGVPRPPPHAGPTLHSPPFLLLPPPCSCIYHFLQRTIPSISYFVHFYALQYVSRSVQFNGLYF